MVYGKLVKTIKTCKGGDELKALTKKRAKAYCIDLAISTAVTGVVEYILRKRIKSEAFHAIVTPSVIMGSLECAQILGSGQTIGYKKMGLILESESESSVTTTQVVKRIMYRDSLSSLKLLMNRKSFEGEDGSILPHDRFAGTVVKEVR